jgi:hypothetical protein
MRVLVACEFSGIVREAFRKRGHEAYSCDLLPAEDNSRYHFQDDVKQVAGPDWDLVIAHPPCTYLSNSGVKHLYHCGVAALGRNPDRWTEMFKAADFFAWFLTGKWPRLCIENPIMHGYAKERLKFYGLPSKQTQIIQPWQFGHGEIKATCLWLRGLPLLRPTNVVAGREPRVHHASPGPNRWKERSRTLQGIAEAMAEQWG